MAQGISSSYCIDHQISIESRCECEFACSFGEAATLTWFRIHMRQRQQEKFSGCSHPTVCLEHCLRFDFNIRDKLICSGSMHCRRSAACHCQSMFALNLLYTWRMKVVSHVSANYPVRMVSHNKFKRELAELSFPNCKLYPTDFLLLIFFAETLEKAILVGNICCTWQSFSRQILSNVLIMK